MPTIAKAELTDSATPMLKVWDLMFAGLLPNARRILDSVGYYSERDMPLPDSTAELTAQEKMELQSIVRVLMEAAIAAEMMPARVLASTLKKVSKLPSLFFSGELPASVQWEIASHYQRGDEKPGSYCMDVWGSELIRCNYPLETPTGANIARAAEAAYRHIEETRSPGRPRNPANRVISAGLGKIFRASGKSIARRRESAGMHKGKVVYSETSSFHNFLELVLPPLQRHLREHDLAPVTLDTVVRLAIAEG